MNKLISPVCLSLVLTAWCSAGELKIANGDFEAGENGKVGDWKWWSRENKGSMEWVDTQKHGGSRSVFVQHDGTRDWAVSSGTRFSVKAGDVFDLSAWVCVRTGSVTLAAVGLKDGKSIKWDIGSASSDAEGAWSKLEARVEVEEPVNGLYVRFVGSGAVAAWLDDVSIAAGRPLSQMPPKPPVKGYAETRVCETQGRGLVAVRAGNGQVYLSWRCLEKDTGDTGFNVYRRVGGEQPVKLTSEPVFRTTDFLDAGAQKTEQPVEYSVRAVVKGAEVSGDKPATARLAGEETGYLRIPLRGSYQVQKAGIADLDGDGKLDYVIKQPIDNIDPADDYWKTSPDTYKLEAYLSDGTFLWQHDMGWDIERGIWYSPYVVYDLDGDGRAEVACKAGEGDHRGEDGRVKSGPEYLDILDGMTGKLRCRTDWVPRSEFRGVDYNRTSRNQLCVAYLDGKTPCLVVDRGTYNLIILVAYEFHDGRLRELWRWSNSRTSRRYWGQGAHWMHGADVDRDGRDEVVVGSAVIDDNGQELWSTGLGHPDHCYVGDLDPERPGLEIYYGIEPSNPKNSMCMVDAATGKILWGYDQRTVHIHSSGLVSDIDPSHPGSECYSGERDEKEKRWLRDCRGNVIAMADIGSLAPRAAYWDSDAQREIVARGAIKKYNGPVLEPKIEGSVVAVADILGDWREEIITTVPGEMRIHVSTIPAADRRTWLMADPVYRMDVVCAAMGYYQVPMLGTDIAARKR